MPIVHLVLLVAGRPRPEQHLPECLQQEIASHRPQHRSRDGARTCTRDGSNMTLSSLDESASLHQPQRSAFMPTTSAANAKTDTPSQPESAYTPGRHSATYADVGISGTRSATCSAIFPSATVHRSRPGCAKRGERPTMSARSSSSRGSGTSSTHASRRRRLDARRHGRDAHRDWARHQRQAQAQTREHEPVRVDGAPRGAM